MKRIITAIFLCCFLISTFVTSAATEELKVVLNGVSIEFPDAKPYINSSGRTLVPVRFVAEALKSNVEWREKTKEVVIVKDKKKIILTIDKEDVFVEDSSGKKAIKLDTVSQLKDTRTFVPLRFVSEVLESTVTWDNNTRTISINTLNNNSGIGENVLKTLIKTPEDALNALEAVKQIYGIQSVKEDLKPLPIQSSGKVVSYKFQQNYKNIPVYGCQLNYVTDNAGKVIVLNGTTIQDIKVDVVPTIKEEDLAKIISTISKDLKIFEKNLVILSQVDLAWKCSVSGLENDMFTAKMIFIDAHKGTIVKDEPLMINLMENTTSTDLSGQQRSFATNKIKSDFELYDTERKIGVYDAGLFSLNYLDLPGSLYENSNNKWDKEAKAISVYTDLIKIYDFYQKALNRKSYDGKGSEIKATINYSKYPLGYGKFTNCCFLTLEDQKVILIGTPSENFRPFEQDGDIVSHELSHGLVSSIIDLLYENESGAINEAFADIMAETSSDDDNWIVGEKLAQGGLRNIANPLSTKYPVEYNGLHSIKETTAPSSSNDRGGVHYNSTVISHSAYLMYKNKIITDKSKIARLYYDALFQLHPKSNFLDLRRAVLKSAALNDYTAEQIVKIEECFNEVKVVDAPKEKEVSLPNTSTSSYDFPIGTNNNMSNLDNNNLTFSISNKLYTTRGNKISELDTTKDLKDMISTPKVIYEHRDKDGKELNIEDVNNYNGDLYFRSGNNIHKLTAGSTISTICSLTKLRNLRLFNKRLYFIRSTEKSENHFSSCDLNGQDLKTHFSSIESFFITDKYAFFKSNFTLYKATFDSDKILFGSGDKFFDSILIVNEFMTYDNKMYCSAGNDGIDTMFGISGLFEINVDNGEYTKLSKGIIDNFNNSDKYRVISDKDSKKGYLIDIAKGKTFQIFNAEIDNICINGDYVSFTSEDTNMKVNNYIGKFDSTTEKFEFTEF